MRRLIAVTVAVTALVLGFAIFTVGCDKNAARVGEHESDAGQAATNQHDMNHQHNGDEAHAMGNHDGMGKSADSSKPYPLDVCLVSGQKLGTMGEPVVIDYQGQEIKFCCGGCIDKFKADPATYLSKLHAAHAPDPTDGSSRTPADYPLDTCVVMAGHKLGPQSVSYMHAGRLVRFCCSDCIARFEQAPQRYLAVLDAAASGHTH